MENPTHRHNLGLVLNLVEDPIVANAESPSVAVATELLRAPGARIATEGENGRVDALYYVPGGRVLLECVQIPDRWSSEKDLVRPYRHLLKPEVSSHLVVGGSVVLEGIAQRPRVGLIFRHGRSRFWPRQHEAFADDQRAVLGNNDLHRESW